MFKSVLKKKSNKLIESAIWITLLMAFTTVFATLQGLPVFKNATAKDTFASAIADQVATEELKNSFVAAEKTLSKNDRDLMSFVNQDRGIASENASEKEVQDLLAKIEAIRHNLNPRVIEIEKQIAEIDSKFVKKNIVFDTVKDDEPGQHVIPVAEGLLGEYGLTGYHNGVFVSEEKDDFGHYPLTIGVSAKEVPKIAKEFERFRAENKYPISVELAHASFLHNFYHNCSKFDSSAACLHPDLEKVKETDRWYASVRREAAGLRAKRRALIELKTMATKYDVAKQKLTQKLRGPAAVL